MLRLPPPLTPARLAFLGLCAVLVAHAAYFFPFLSDDALISLRYAERFANGHGLTWTAGERVEGYTDLLWVILNAAFYRVGVDTILSARALDLLGTLAALALLGISPRTGSWSVPRLIAGGGLFVTSAAVAVWSIGALEHGFMTGVLSLAILLLLRNRDSRRERLALQLSLAALALLRADGIVLGAALLAGACFIPRLSRSSVLGALRISLFPLGAILLQLAFRRAYYGEWQPNTALAKLALNPARLELGARYLGHAYGVLGAFLLVAIWATWVAQERGAFRPLLVPWALCLGWSAYLCLVGGDIFPGWRPMVFVAVGLAFIVAEGAERAFVPSLRVALGLGLALVLHANLQRTDPENQRAKAELWEWDGLPVGTLLKTAFGARDPLLAVDAAGALPYWSGLRSLDMLGLNDRYIATHPPPGFGTGPIGHELGDGAYVFGRKPDLIAFNNAAGHARPFFTSGKQMLRMSAFRQSYQWIRVQGATGNRAYGEIWVRREGSDLGVQRTEEGVMVPGYFLTGQASDATARLDPRGQLVAELTDRTPGVLHPLKLPRGSYRVRLLPEQPDAVVGLRCKSFSMQRRASGDPKVFRLDSEQAISVAVAPRGGTLRLERVLLSRESDRPARYRCASNREEIDRSIDDLSSPRPENAYWAHPSNVLFRRALGVRLPTLRHPRRVEISVDNNDIYEVELWHDGRVVFRTTLSPRDNGGGMAVHAIDAPAEVREQGIDRIRVTAREGDGAYSVGHLKLEP